MEQVIRSFRKGDTTLQQLRYTPGTAEIIKHSRFWFAYRGNNIMLGKSGKTAREAMERLCETI